MPVCIRVRPGILKFFALDTAANAHDKCLLLRHVFKNAGGITLDGEKLRGLGHVFEDLMTDLESIEAALDPG